jgi:hypothetical protein
LATAGDAGADALGSYRVAVLVVVIGAVKKLTARCAKFLHNGQQGPHTWVTMADPWGNEFCVSQ